MASIPEFYSSSNHNNTLFLDYSDQISGLLVPPAALEISDGGAMWSCTDEDFRVTYFDDFGLMDGFSLSSPAPAPAPEEEIGIGDGVVPAFSGEYRNNMNNYNISLIDGIIPGDQNFGGLGYNNGFDPFGEEYCFPASFLPEFKPFSFVGEQNNWGIQSNQMNGIEESNVMKVGRYSEEERKERIVRYLKKRNQRNFNKTIKYACRKTLADRRVRVRGRFARNSDHHDDQQIVAEKNNGNDDPTRKDVQLFFDDALPMIKYDDDDEEWLRNFAVCCWVNGGSTT